MLFSSLTFIYLFLPVLCVYYYLAKSVTARKTVLLIFSLIFYAWGEPVFVLLMVGSVSVNYLAGLFIERATTRSRKRAYMIISVVMNLAILGVFKYTSLFVETLNIIPFVSLPVPELVLPLGISFYTFQAMSYTIDVYRGDTPAQRSFPSLLLYVSFFPQLIAGPIVRYKDIAAQLPDRRVDTDRIFDGVFRFGVGLAKKVLLANPCGSAAETLLNMDVSSRAVLGEWAGILFFALQIYFDFSGYSDMAIGLGRMFGFEFRENFDYPYISKSATEFWRRWHISLGTFFRDYVYIPLGGNRKHWLFNVFAVWLLTGLWHGASWNFVLWGLYYAVLLVIEKKLLIKLFDALPRVISGIIRYIYMTAVTLFGWTIFYYTDFSALRNAIASMTGFGGLPASDIFVESVLRENLLLLVLALFFAFPFAKKLLTSLFSRFKSEVPLSAAKTAFILAVLFLSTASLIGDSYNPFLYFRF